jgi:predicted RNase H-like HicB family nuclease
LNPEDSGYVALCPELDIASQGESLDEALANLKEAVEGFFEAASSSEKVGSNVPCLLIRFRRMGSRWRGSRERLTTLEQKIEYYFNHKSNIGTKAQR